MDPLRMMELGVDGTFKRRLKPDAAPNVPLASPDPEKKNGHVYTWSKSIDCLALIMMMFSSRATRLPMEKEHRLVGINHDLVFE
jgi:hypothetical protein